MIPEEQRKHTYDINVVLDRILQQNPQIVTSRIELFSEVYYPIAILEIEMTETTFEDFDLVPLSVLKFISAGLVTASEIAGMMGLSASYVQKNIDLLMGYGYVDAHGLTDVGTQALKIEKKVAHSAVKQRFQADAITGDLLKIGEQPFESDLQGREKTFFAIPHMPHIEGISVEEINQQLMGTDLTKYKHYQGEILNANVDTIKGVECIGLEYIRAYLVKMQGIDSPFIISYKYDASKKGFNERFRWQPMRMPCEKAYTEYGFSRDIECYSDQSLKTINALYELVCKNIVEIDEKRLKKLLGHIQPFDYSTMDISMGRITSGVPEQISVYVNSNSFMKWNNFVLTFLEQYDNITGYLFTNSWLNGLFVRFESQSPDIRKAAKAYKKALRHFDRKQLTTYIRKNLFDKNSEDMAIDFSELVQVLEDYEKESDD